MVKQSCRLGEGDPAVCSGRQRLRGQRGLRLQLVLKHGPQPLQPTIGVRALAAPAESRAWCRNGMPAKSDYK